MQRLRLTHPALTFHVGASVHERDGRFMATADLAEDSRDVGVGSTGQESVRAALKALGEPCASERRSRPGQTNVRLPCTPVQVTAL
jgi:hypothetical protein